MICQTPDCQNETKGNRKHCGTCRWRKWRDNNPYKYHYRNLRNRARQRGKSFTLTLEEFKKIWQRHPEKWKLKIDTSINCPYQIDRKDNEKGYYYDNLQIITAEENIKKWYQQDKEYVDNIPDEAPF